MRPTDEQQAIVEAVRSGKQLASVSPEDGAD